MHIRMLIKSQSEVHLHTGRSVRFHPSQFTTFSIFEGLVLRLLPVWHFWAHFQLKFSKRVVRMCTTCNKLWPSVCTVQSRPTFQDIGCHCTVSIEATVTKILDIFITVGSVKTLQLYFSRSMWALTTSCECVERSHWSVTCKDTIIHKSCLLDSSCQCYLPSYLHSLFKR